MTHLSDPFRLPRTVIPHRYEVRLEPNLENATFVGNVTIHATATSANEIVMNAKDLEILTVSVNGAPTEWALHLPTERLVIASIANGPVSIDIQFNGTLNDRLRGFYRSTFRDEHGNDRVIATTQMQSTDCRAAFPCFDEPDFKAVFSITLVVQPDLLSISNGVEISRKSLPDGRNEVQFSDTMKMSTYLVAFVVGPLEATPPVLVNGVPIRVVHVPGKSQLAKFGLEAGAFALNWFHEYYGIPYPSEKVDMVALPDFAAGAMENVGCVTFREVLLLVDPATSTTAEQQVLADVVAHELAHMWFGDLVTMKWWNGIWLNEAFATFMGVAACDAFLPHLQRWTTFGLERSMAFEVDSLESTRPIEFEVKSPQDSEGMFDLLTYEKGGSLLRMLEMYLGQERFRQGVSHYLKKHAYGNTETNDLWDAIEEVVSNDGGDEVPVRRLMDSWIWQPGYPLVSASLSGRNLNLSQSRFSFSKDIKHDSAWVVPIHIRNDDTEIRVLLDSKETSIELPHPGEPVVVNAGGHGFYRVAYTPEMLGRLSGSTLMSLSTLERYSLVDDAWSAVTAGRLTAKEFLAFVNGFEAERDLAVWQIIGTSLTTLSRVIPDTARSYFEARVNDLTSSAYTELGWETSVGESDLRRQLRGYIILLSANLAKNPDAIAQARKIWSDVQGDKKQIDPELMSTITSIVASNGDSETFTEMINLYRSATTPQDSIRYLYSLGQFNDPNLIQKACDFAFSSEVKTQDAPFLLNRIMTNRVYGHVAWKSVRENWSKANKDFPINSIIRMVDPIKTLLTDELVADVQEFFQIHEIPQASLTLKQALERQLVNAALRKRNINDWQ